MSEARTYRIDELVRPPVTNKSPARWIEYADPVEVLWTDTQGIPHLARGSFEGLRVPEDGGSIELVLDLVPGEFAIGSHRVAGITPLVCPE